MLQFGSWFTPDTKSVWEDRLEETSDYIIERTGMSRRDLRQLLEYLEEERIIR